MNLWDDLPSLADAARKILPADDATIDALAPTERARIARDWAGRAHAELGAASVFAAVSRGLFGLAASREILWLSARAVTDEIRHSEICRYVALRYGGVEPPRTDPPDVGTPPFGRAGESDCRLFHAVLNCCINEGIGSAFLQACLERATGPLARAALRELLADDIDHARIGWALLASPRLPQSSREELERALPTLIRVGRGVWLDPLDGETSDPPSGHGSLSRAEVRTVVDEALRQLILPGFERVGIANERAWRVLQEGTERGEPGGGHACDPQDGD